MYSSRGFRDWEIGDIDVVVHEGTFHLFHLIIPNHDYIAHAVSKDGINWTRVKNAMFVGEPGEWDDDMLWTMNVQRSQSGFTMYYTGLTRRDNGRIQRIGMAKSSDLYNWKKVDEAPYPIASAGPHYESPQDNPRTWVSFRDPFFFRHGEDEYLTMCARTNQGAVHRRGCAGIAHKTNGGDWELLPPLHWPRVYDDVECPCVFSIGDLWFLVGSIREDVQVRYWYAYHPLGPYQARSENVLFPKGNYATRVAYDGDKLLLYSFFIMGKDVTGTRVLPAPKEVGVSQNGQLYLTSYSEWNKKVIETRRPSAEGKPRAVLGNPSAYSAVAAETLRLGSESGYELFLYDTGSEQIRLSGTMQVERIGKLGFILSADQEGCGYYITIDVLNGYTQVRAWGENTSDVFEDYIFDPLQANHFHCGNGFQFEIIDYGHYLEMSLCGKIILSLMDYRYDGTHFGFYCSSASIAVEDLTLEILEEPRDEYAGEV